MVPVEVDPPLGDVPVHPIDPANFLVEVIEGKSDKIVKFESENVQESVAENGRGIPRIHDGHENRSGIGNDGLDLFFRAEFDRHDHGETRVKCAKRRPSFRKRAGRRRETP